MHSASPLFKSTILLLERFLPTVWPHTPLTKILQEFEDYTRRGTGVTRVATGRGHEFMTKFMANFVAKFAVIILTISIVTIVFVISFHSQYFLEVRPSSPMRVDAESPGNFVTFLLISFRGDTKVPTTCCDASSSQFSGRSKNSPAILSSYIPVGWISG